jgi:hypothetical protein
VRFSVWGEEGVAEAAVSVSGSDADRLAVFLQRARPGPGHVGVADRLRRAVGAIRVR